MTVTHSFFIFCFIVLLGTDNVEWVVKTTASVTSCKWFRGEEQLVGEDFKFKETEVGGTKQHTLVFNEVYPDDADKYRVVISDGDKTIECSASFTGKVFYDQLMKWCECEYEI